MRRILVLIVLALLSDLPPGAAEAADRTDRPRALVVPSDVRTIQGAIDAAADGSRIVIMAGIYEETLTIRGKRLHLVGRGNPEIRGPAPDRERMRDLSRASGLITYAAGGGGSVDGVMLTGGDNAIVGLSGDEPPGALELTHIRVQGSGRAVLWCCTSLTIKNSHFSKLAWHGISIPCAVLPLQALFVDGVAIVDSVQAGIYMCNAAGVATCDPNIATHVIKNASLAFNQGGGILAVHSQLCVKSSNIDFPATAGMIFLGSSAVTRGNDINFSKHLTGNVLGDGVLTFPWQGVPSAVTVENTTVYHAEGVGVRNLGSHVALKSSFMVCSVDEHALVSADSGGFAQTFADLGGNKCGCPFANASCLGVPGAPEPPAPVGGLE